MADLYQTEQVQLVLFEAFFADGEKEQSRTLDIYDALPKFSLSWAREGEQQSSLREFNNVRIQDKLIKVSVSAAILSSGSEPGSKDTQAKKPKTVFPGVREELVERALRKMAVQRQIDARLEAEMAARDQTVEEWNLIAERRLKPYTVQGKYEARTHQHSCSGFWAGRILCVRAGKLALSRDPIR